MFKFWKRSAETSKDTIDAKVEVPEMEPEAREIVQDLRQMLRDAGFHWRPLENTDALNFTPHKEQRTFNDGLSGYISIDRTYELVSEHGNPVKLITPTGTVTLYQRASSMGWNVKSPERFWKALLVSDKFELSGFRVEHPYISPELDATLSVPLYHNNSNARVYIRKAKGKK